MVGDTRQGWAVMAAMLVIFVPLTFWAYFAEQSGNPRLEALAVDQAVSTTHSGGNMEGKEVRFGIASSALWAAATTAAANGSVNAMHGSFTPLGGLLPMWLMQLGEVVIGGAGSGLYGMLMFAINAVFIAGLMVGRTPEYLGKKIEAFEVQMASLVVLIPCCVVLLESLVLVLDPNTYELRESVLVDLLGNRTWLELTDSVPNAGLPADTFVFEQPAGTEVIDVRGRP